MPNHEGAGPYRERSAVVQRRRGFPDVMIAAQFLDISPRIVQGATIAVGICAIALLVRALWIHPRPAWDAMTPLPRGRELALLGVILAGAAAMRLAWWRSGVTAPFWFSETEPLHFAKLLQLGTTWSVWRQSWQNFQVGWLHDSPLTLPVALAFQWLLGPSFHLPMVIGAFYGTLGVLLAWAVGRAMHSPAVGLLFAAFLAASPLQLVWSRLGGLYIACVPQLLLTIWLGWQAGHRRSLFIALLAGIVAFSSLYYYFAARVGIPLGMIALVFGARARGVSWKRLAMLASLWALAFGVAYWWIALSHGATFATSVWPRYGGYVGNKGERTLSDLVTRNTQEVTQQLRRAYQQYFLWDRAFGEPRLRWFDWSARSGGLALMPTALLGLVGLLVTLLRPGRAWLWLAVAAAGIIIPSLSVSSARRFLVLDVAWAALAASGLLALARSRLGRALSPTTVRWTVATVPVLVAAWSFGTVVALNVTLARRVTPLPFGESGFGDGLACRRCFEAGREWQREIADGAFIILGDTDLERENRTSPGGLPLYGKLAALSAGRPDQFVDLYAAMEDFDIEPPSAGILYDRSRTTFDAWIAGRIENARPGRILWHFERPTQWERWLADRLAAAGGTLRTFDTPLAATPAIEVETPWTERQPAFAVLRELAAPAVAPPAPCFDLRRVATTRIESFPLALASAPDSKDGARPDWAIGSWYSLWFREHTVAFTAPAGLAVERDSTNEKAVRVHCLGRRGEYAIYDGPPGASRPAPGVPVAGLLGLDCAARVGANWWTVDATTGKLSTTDREAKWLPAGAWAGITRAPGGDVVLASADQSLVVLDVARQTERQRFPALVGPSRRVTTGECTPVLAGDGWYATFNNVLSTLSFYDAAGRPLGTAALDRAVGLPGNAIVSVAAAGDRIGVAHPGSVDTLAVEIRPGCTTPDTPPG